MLSGPSGCTLLRRCHCSGVSVCPEGVGKRGWPSPVRSCYGLVIAAGGFKPGSRVMSVVKVGGTSVRKDTLIALTRYRRNISAPLGDSDGEEDSVNSPGTNVREPALNSCRKRRNPVCPLYRRAIGNDDSSGTVMPTSAAPLTQRWSQDRNTVTMASLQLSGDHRACEVAERFNAPGISRCHEQPQFTIKQLDNHRVG